MNDNPTTSSSAKATADRGEWTVDDVCNIVGESPVFGAQAIVNAHNAALAAAWRKGHADAQEPALEYIDELHQQLAAERTKAKNWEETAAMYCRNWEDAKQQLAAERNTIAGLHRIIDGHDNQIAQLREQLATAVAALKVANVVSMEGRTTQRRTYQQSLKLIGDTIDAALAKVEEQPVQLPMINEDPVITLK